MDTLGSMMVCSLRGRHGLVALSLAEREDRGVLSGGHVEEFSGTFVVPGNAGADCEVGTAIDQQLGDFGVHAFEVGQGVEDRGLAADAAGVDVSAGVDVGAAVEQAAGRSDSPVVQVP